MSMISRQARQSLEDRFGSQVDSLTRQQARDLLGDGHVCLSLLEKQGTASPLVRSAIMKILSNRTRTTQKPLIDLEF